MVKLTDEGEDLAHAIEGALIKLSKLKERTEKK